MEYLHYFKEYDDFVEGLAKYNTPWVGFNGFDVRNTGNEMSYDMKNAQSWKWTNEVGTSNYSYEDGLFNKLWSNRPSGTTGVLIYNKNGVFEGAYRISVTNRSGGIGQEGRYYRVTFTFSGPTKYNNAILSRYTEDVDNTTMYTVPSGFELGMGFVFVPESVVNEMNPVK